MSSFDPDKNLPGCMMPDGGECCESYAALYADWKRLRALSRSEAPANRNWIEDATHENGNYECSCVECGQSFIGHKRRVLCKLCSNLLRPRSEAPVAWQYELHTFDGGVFWQPQINTEKPEPSNKIRNLRPLYAVPSGAELSGLRESLHDANGVADLAIKHRDTAEALVGIADPPSQPDTGAGGAGKPDRCSKADAPCTRDC